MMAVTGPTRKHRPTLGRGRASAYCLRQQELHGFWTQTWFLDSLHGFWTHSMVFGLSYMVFGLIHGFWTQIKTQETCPVIDFDCVYTMEVLQGEWILCILDIVFLGHCELKGTVYRKLTWGKSGINR
jgi:hypothetical protein